MSDVERSHSERLSRQKAAERLADVAYALTTGGSLELSVDGERLSVPLAEDVLLERDLKAAADRVELELSLSWQSPSTPTRGASPMSAADQIRASLASDPRIHHPAEIAVSERAGNVTLRGTVAGIHQRRTAVGIARSVAGVATVDDRLRIDPRADVRDGEIRGAALQALMSDAGVPVDRVDVSVSSGWLTLTGEVARQTESDAAFAAVSAVDGVGGITNRITVITAGLDG